MVISWNLFLLRERCEAGEERISVISGYILYSLASPEVYRRCWVCNASMTGNRCPNGKNPKISVQLIDRAAGKWDETLVGATRVRQGNIFVALPIGIATIGGPYSLISGVKFTSTALGVFQARVEAQSIPT
jgi:hypothetical protein